MSFVAVAAVLAWVAACSSGSSQSGSDAGGEAGGGGDGGNGDGGSGDGGNGGACPSSFTACGGNLVGTWQLSALCGNVASSLCAAATSTVTPVPNATVTFGSDGSVSRNESSGSVTVDLTLPPSCFDPDGGISVTCDQLGGKFAGTCTGGPPADCTCVIPQTINATSNSGTYTTSGSSVTIQSGTDAGGSSDVFDYCVQGNTLMLESSSTEFDVFTKQ